MSVAVPPQEVIDAIMAPSTIIYRRVDIYEEDGRTPYLLDVPISAGSIGVDYSRAERRTLDGLTIINADKTIRHGPGYLWYDKVFKPYRGIYYGVQQTKYEWPLGVFLPSSISTQHHPDTISVKCTDRTKQLKEDKFAVSTTFAKGRSPHDIIEALARNGGITDFNLAPIPGLTTKDFAFEKDTPRWDAMLEIATAYGQELFFDAYGYLVTRHFLDPFADPTTFSFVTGPTVGNMISWTKTSSDAELYNVVIVYGAQDGQKLPPYAVAENHDPHSPTSIENLKRRKCMPVITSSSVTTQAQAQALANKMLKVASMEDFDVSMESLVFPWLEAGAIVEFKPDDQAFDDPTRFLLSSFSIPLTAGSMNPVAKRVQLVGDF